MPNSQNRNNSGGNGNQGQPKHRSSRTTGSKINEERSDIKHNTNNNDGNTSRTSNQGRKSASGGS